MTPSSSNQSFEPQPDRPAPVKKSGNKRREYIHQAWYVYLSPDAGLKLSQYQHDLS